MARRTPVIATTFAVSAALLLSACGGGGGNSSSDKIKGADDAPSKTPAASASASSGAARPKIEIPKSFQLNFQGWTSDDSDEQAVLDDGKEQVRAGYAAITANDPKASYLSFYDTAAGLSQDRKWIKTYTDKDLTVIGKAPVFDAKATLLGSNKSRAMLSYCMDESKAYSKNRKTGKTEGNPAGTDPEVFYTATLQKSDKAVWQTVSVDSKRGGCPS